MKKLNLTLLLAVFCTAFSFGQVPIYVPTNGLVGWWPFNGNANDESGNGNNLINNGALLTTDRLGLQSKAYSYSGQAGNGVTGTYMTIPNIGINMMDSFSISIWVYEQSVLGDGESFISFGDNGSSISIYRNGYSLPTSGAGLLGLAYGNTQVISSTSAIQNQWVMYSITRENNFLKGYINDSLIGTVSNLTPTSISNSGNYIARHTWGPASNQTSTRFNGKLDDIGIWNRALTQQEITALYQSCNLNLSANPTQANPTVGANATFSTSGATTYQWQTNPANNGWQNVNNNSTYSGAATASLSVNNVQLYNHQQQFRVVGISGSCADTAYASIVLADSCVNTVYDTITTTIYDTLTTSITVTDTLLINAVLSGLNPPNNTNTLQVYPNPARTHITIDNGNFALMNGYTVRINNALGQTVFSQAVNQQQFFIDLSGWTGNGFYYLDLLDPQGNSIERKVIVVQ
jgi:hypothetical protein